MGLLTVEGIKAHTFSPELLVISGCETAQGPLLGTEGLMSLSRHFIAQGAKAVLATLWPVSDRASAMFMGHFYETLLATNNPAESLRRAQLALMRDPTYRHPFYWSGFVLTVADATASPLP